VNEKVLDGEDLWAICRKTKRLAGAFKPSKRNERRNTDILLHRWARPQSAKTREDVGSILAHLVADKTTANRGD
jgi:hypothetical protein